jgi:uncharacterized membrane protein
MMLWAKAFAATLAVFAVLDAIWLASMKRLYRAELGSLMSPKVTWGAAAAFYLIFAAGLAFFAVLPSQQRALHEVFLTGAFFGLVTYGTYDLTNLATLAGWPIRLSAIDMAWGSVLCGIATLAGAQALALL